MVNLEYEDGTVASFTMSPFSLGGRKIRIMGTKGEIYGEMKNDYVTLSNYETGETVEIKVEDAVLDETIDGGHGGGDDAVMVDFCDLLTGKYQGNEITNVRESVESHLIAFAAEESRKSGAVINMDEYVKKISQKF